MGATPPATRRSRQVVFSGRDELAFTHTTVPDPGPDDMIVAIRRVGICATDLHLLAGHIGDPFPLVPGHEFVGEVAAVGEGAERRRGVAPGDPVAVEMLLPCRSCPRCREGRYNLCERDDMSRGLDRGRQYGVNIPRTVTPGLWGGYADHLYVPAQAIVHRLPAGLDWDTAVLTEPAAVAVHAVERAGVRPGETVAVLGPGPVGILTAAAARTAGAGGVAMLGTRPSRLKVAHRFGVDETFDARSQNVGDDVAAALGAAPDVVFETAGVAEAQVAAARLVRRGGRVVLAGACGSQVPVTFHQDEDLFLKELDLRASFLSSGGFEPAISMLARGNFPYTDLVTHTFGLDEVERAFATVRNREGDIIKAVLDPARTSAPAK